MPKCRVLDCPIKNAIFNNSGETRGICCAKHKEDDMIDIKNKSCIYEGCNIQSNYNLPGEKIGLYCAKHKEDDMIDVKNKSCIYEGCNILPSYNYPGEKISIYCATHKDHNMMDIRSKTCISEGCNIRASYNLQGEKIAIFCAKHKECDMVNVIKKCISEGCNIIPIYNYPGEKIALYCSKHKLDDMIDIKNKKCNFEDCNIRPIYNYPGEKIPLCCVKHKEDDMIDIVSKRCINEHCNIQSSNTKYQGYCFSHYIENFPDEPITRNYKVKENLVVDYVKHEFREYNLVFDKIIQGGNSRRRPDILITKSTHSIIIENDENGHDQKYYEDENNRTIEIHNDLRNNKTVFIRFNPDSYIDENGKKVKSCFKIDKDTGLCRLVNEVEWNNRLETLKKTIEEYITTIPEKEITIIYLFYNKNTSS